ncbi:Orotidine 5'-phosphate decarboxylase [Labilithrix luteola]|uniref:Orotidine 5'-phosphate decarboxylase n=1 Tax=Labilithrix luteola TaxID=1391654 RepID=A0A0K1Q8S4_9BACT|nr:orotidine-5'-phosphate decarboxylase [Labilithrix luteola]AKV01795.1 Orotidine 5'-phosphate decarboxylase [Labilithrix luteola]
MSLTEQARPPIAFALDFADRAEALAAAREVAPAIGMVKVGLELFVREGPSVVTLGRDVGLPVFLDLKLHDIPETVERAVAQASTLGARLVTVHASGGRTMLNRAVARAESEGAGLAVCAVTILTSLDDADLDDIGFESGVTLPPEPDGIVRTRTSYAAEKLARLAWDEGVRWFVCSPAEVKYLRRALGPDAVLVTPGVRPAGGNTTDDQKRVATPERAIQDGASWVVVGRPIRDAKDRLVAARSIADAIARVKVSS